MTQQFGRGNPEVERIIAEMTALNTSLKATRDPQEAPEARRLVHELWSSRGEKSAQTCEEILIRTAMAHILGEPLPTTPSEALPDTTPWIPYVSYIIGFAWMLWAQGNVEEARKILDPLHTECERREVEEDPGAVHLLTLYLWAQAVEALLHGSLSEAQRLWNRAAEIGSSFGTESHPMILWTMAATFFPVRTT